MDTTLPEERDNPEYGTSRYLTSKALVGYVGKRVPWIPPANYMGTRRRTKYRSTILTFCFFFLFLNM